MKVAVIGSGISGNSAAADLASHAHVTLYETDTRLGGHSHTVDVTLPAADGTPVTHGVDTGFLVFNPRTYPRLVALFNQLSVPVANADMSFSVQAPGWAGGEALEWSGADLSTVFAQRSNLLRPRFWGMLSDIVRFNRLCTGLAQSGEADANLQPLGEFLDQHRFGPVFRDGYLLPMLGCIWSCPTDQMLQFPVATMVRFCHNHGLLQVNDRPQWKTVAGGSREYVKRLLAPVTDVRLGCPVRKVVRKGATVDVVTDQGTETFDHVVMASHSDQTLAMLANPSPTERAVLGAIRYQPNLAVLHTDTRMLPRRKAAWAAWNYERTVATGQHSAQVCLHYLINRLQPLPFAQPVIVSLNPARDIRADAVLARIDYAHPVFDAAAIRAQRHIEAIQGTGGVWFCGAWTGYGFHEDGLRSGQKVVDRLLANADRLAA
ncbi:MAG: FAD-dependent oxidoreductase [Burkholderiales bacterium]|nr:FAD-dependent oxidoreductase [Burkholderiales bacterium]